MSNYEKGRVKRIRQYPLLSVGEQDRIRDRIQQDKAYLDSFRRAPDGDSAEAHLAPRSVGRSVDGDAVLTRIKRNEKALERMSPENRKITGVARQTAFKELKGHEEWLKKHMLTTYEMGAYPSATDPVKDHNYRKAADKSFAMEIGNPEFQKRANRAKELARLLEPADAELCNLERLRARRRY